MKKEKSYAWGIRGVHFIWHGNTSDPEVMYKGKKMSYWTVEDSMWELFMDREGLPADIVKTKRDEEGMSVDEKFCQWMRMKPQTLMVKHMILDYGE